MTDPGTSFEERVFELLQELEVAGLAKDLRQSTTRHDRAGVARQIDVFFTLATDLVDLRVLVECKAHHRNISLADIDQIRVLKNSLPEQNICWLISRTPASQAARTAMRDAGIAFYEFSDLQQRVRRAIDATREYRHHIHALEHPPFWPANPSFAYHTMEEITMLRDEALVDGWAHILLSHLFDRIRPFLAARIDERRQREATHAAEITAHNSRVEALCQKLRNSGGFCWRCESFHHSYKTALGLGRERKYVVCRSCGCGFEDELKLISPT